MDEAEISLQRALLAAACITMALAWLIPNHYPPWVSFYNECAMGIALLCLFVVHSLRHGEREVPVPALWLLAVATIPMVQWASGLLFFSGDAAVASTYVLATAMSVVVGHSLARDECRDLPVLLCKAAIAAAAVSCVISGSQVLQLTGWGIWGESATPDMRAVGNLAQPNNFSTLLGLSSLSALYLFERGRLRSWAAMALVVLFLVVGSLTQSRISLAFGPLVLTGWMIGKRGGLVLKVPGRVLAALTGLHWFLMLTLPMLVRHLTSVGPDTLVQRGLQTPRYQMWWMLLQSLGERPWFGFGWLQTGEAELAVVDRFPPIRELWLEPHSLFVDLVISNGWPLGLVLGLCLLYWFVSRASRLRSVEALVGMLVVGFVGAHSLVEFPYQYAYFLIPTALWVGIVEREQRRPTVAAGHGMAIPAALAVLSFFLICWEYPAMETDFRLVRFEGARIDRMRAIESTPAAPMLSSLTAFLRFSRRPPVADMTAAQLAEMEAVVKRYPYAASLVRYASALALNGRLPEAKRTFIKIRYIFGDRLYEAMRNDFRERAEGNAGLQDLVAVLPAASTLAP